MPIQIEYEDDDIYVLRISGVLKHSEFSAEQNALARRIDSGSEPRLLFILENFDVGSAARTGMTWTSRSRKVAKFPRLHLSRSHVGKHLHLLLSEQEYAARQ
jgi:hypothetical protein